MTTIKNTKLALFIAGIFFLFLGGIIYILPMVIDVKSDYTEEWYIPMIISSFGVVILWKPQLIVDKFFGIIDFILRKKSNPKE